MEIPNKLICAQVYFALEDNNGDRILDLTAFLNTQNNCQCISSQFIASETQERHSCGNTEPIDDTHSPLFLHHRNAI